MSVFHVGDHVLQSSQITFGRHSCRFISGHADDSPVPWIVHGICKFCFVCELYVSNHDCLTLANCLCINAIQLILCLITMSSGGEC